MNMEFIFIILVTESMTFMNCGRAGYAVSCYRAAGIVDITNTHRWPQAINA